MNARWGITAALAIAIVSPVLRERAWDSFPISSFPMFSRDLGTKVWLGHVILVNPDGTRRPAPPSIVGSPEPMMAVKIVENALARDEAPGLCQRIAGRVEPGVEVEIVVSVFDSTRYFPDRTPLERTVRARCKSWR